MQEIALILVAAAILALAWVLHRRDRVHRSDRIVLLESIERAAEGASKCPDALSLAEATLRPLTTAFSPADGLLALWTVDPPREGCVEGHTKALWRPLRLPREIEDYLSRGEGAIRVADLDARVVRDPSLRPVLLHLRERGVALFVPGVAGGEAQGALLVPAPIGDVELDDEVVAALDQMMLFVAPQLAHTAALARASDREAAWVVERRNMRAALDRERARAREAIAPTRPTFVARSAAMRDLLGEIDDRAEGSEPLLIEAAAGSGAGRVARAIHAASPFSEGAFIEREARRLRPTDLRPDGVASGGTLFVRDVAGLSDSLVEPLVGAVRTHPFRLVVSTRVDLLPLASEGRFDARLWELLRSGRIRVPTLVERSEDLAELATIRLRNQAVALARPELRLSPKALERILRYPWPGNVPELDLVLREAALGAQGSQIEAGELRLPERAVAAPSPEAPPKEKAPTDSAEN